MPARAKKTDEEIQQDVFRELRLGSLVEPQEIGVDVDNGIVTLTGTVDSHAKKLAGRQAAHRVIGVLDVADDVQVKVPGTPRRTDTEIAQAVRGALERDGLLPDRQIHSTVSEGSVTLEGEVTTLREKLDADRAVCFLSGVKSVDNRLSVAPPKADPRQLHQAIEEALERRADREAEKIRVTLSDGTVTLEGRVRSWPEKDAILGTVTHARGVEHVTDHLSVRPWE